MLSVHRPQQRVHTLCDITRVVTPAAADCGQVTGSCEINKYANAVTLRGAGRGRLSHHMSETVLDSCSLA
ncbi:hypothetical protein ACER0C_016119 [Sarotherodon galilaeus]